MTPKDFVKTNSGGEKLETGTNRLVLAYWLSMLIIVAAIGVSYTILRDSIATQKNLHQFNSHIHRVQLSITDSISTLNDYRIESKKNNANPRLKQLIAQRVKASIESLDSIEMDLQEHSKVFKGTNIWPEISWIVESNENSLNFKLNSYHRQMKSKLSDKEGAAPISIPPIPIEAAGARDGALSLGYKKASEQVSELVDRNSSKVDTLHVILTVFIITVMLLISALVVVPLWYRLMSEHRRLESAHSKLYSIAYTDKQTGLPNLHGLEKKLPELIGIKEEEAEFYLFLVRIRNLDEIYNLIGSHSANELFQAFCARLEAYDTNETQWCRSGEPEFCCLLTEAKVQDSDLWAQTLHQFLTERLIIDGIIVRTELSFAASRLDKSNTMRAIMLSDHLSNARLASADFKPPEQWLPKYHPDMNDVLFDQNNLIDQIAEGLLQNQFVPFYQLKVDAQTGRHSSVEVLARWKLSENNFESPAVFIPVAENTGLIVAMTFSIFEQVLEDINDWCASGTPVGRVAINIARDVLLHDEFAQRLQNMLDHLPESCEGLEIEITENIAIGENFERTCAILSDIRNMGVHVSIDDFGTGYASLQTLIDLPFDVLKVDRAFVLPMTEIGTGNEVVSAMISLSNTLGKTCVIEGVETAWQWRLLADMGATELQGFYFHKPAEARMVKDTMNFGNTSRSAA